MKLGDIIDKIFELRQKKDDINAELKELNAEINDLEYQAICAMDDAGLDKTSTGSGSVSMKIEQYPNVTDLNSLVNWAFENGKPEILQRRVSKGVFKEYFEETGEYPDGIDTFEKKTLNYRRR